MYIRKYSSNGQCHQLRFSHDHVVLALLQCSVTSTSVEIHKAWTSCTRRRLWPYTVEPKKYKLNDKQSILADSWFSYDLTCLDVQLVKTDCSLDWSVTTQVSLNAGGSTIDLKTTLIQQLAAHGFVSRTAESIRKPRSSPHVHQPAQLHSFALSAGGVSLADEAWTQVCRILRKNW